MNGGIKNERKMRNMSDILTKNGYVTQIIGPVIDAVFPAGNLPKIYNALTVTYSGKIVVCEVQQLLGDNKVRAVSMSSTDGLQRGVEVIDTGAAIAVPRSQGRLAAHTAPAQQPVLARRLVHHGRAGCGGRLPRPQRRTGAGVTG